MQESEKSSALKLGIVTVFYPRMELDHIESWIRYHLNLGFHKIYLYDNGTRTIDWHFGNKKKEIVWAKKPEANYNLELSDEAVASSMSSLLEPFVRAGKVEVIPWPNKGWIFRRDFVQCQKQAGRHCLQMLEKSGAVDWLAFIDIDELIVTPSVSLGDVVARYQSEGFEGVQMHQKLFESRWGVNGDPILYNDLTKTFGLLDWNWKVFVRVGKVHEWKIVHRAETSTPEKRVTADPNLLRFHHFRGNKHYGKIVKWNISKYVTLNLTGEEDNTHCRWFP